MKKALKNTQHSRYWMDDDIFDNVNIEKGSPKESINKAMRLSAIRRAIGNFVSIMSGANVPVEFNNGNNSYTDGKKVVIAADDNPKNFDTMVGLALHEGSHILLTDFDFVKIVGHAIDIPYSAEPILHPSLVERFKANVTATDYDGDGYRRSYEWYNPVRNALSNIKDIANILEDRRIDAYVYRNAKGYRPYYNALYEKYFLNKDITQNIVNNPDWRVPTITNYINQLLLVIHPSFDPYALPNLQAIVSMMDLKNIDRLAPQHTPKINGKYAYKTDLCYENTPELWKVANEIYVAILKNIEDASNAPDSDEDSDSQGNDSDNNMDGDGEEQKPTADNKNASGAHNPTAGAKAMDKLHDLLDGAVRKKKVTRKLQQTLDSIEKADATIATANIEGYAPVECLVVNKMTENIVKESWFPFGRAWREGMYDEQISAGKRMGAIMSNRLQIRNDPLYTKNTRLDNGKIDRRLLANLGMNIDSVFYKDRIDIHRPVMLHISLDGSASMRGEAWNNCVVVSTALAYVASKIQNIDVVISLRGADRGDMPVVVIAYDSRRDTFSKYIRNITSITPSGVTPEGLCFEAIKDMVVECKDTHDVYFINYSDGEPVFHINNKGQNFCYTGEMAYKHTRKQVNNFRENGVKVLSHFIESGHAGDATKRAFRQMYGDSASFIDVNNVTQVLNVMNKKLAER